MERIRPAAVVGSFYPSDEGELSALLDHCFLSHPLGPGGRPSPATALVAGLVPHAGYVYSGPCAAHLYARLPATLERVIIIGVNHWARGHRAALSPADAWQTPLGRVPVDQELNALLEKRLDLLKKDERAHAQEHSIEVQLPFLQRVLGKFVFVPISLSDLSQAECAALGGAIAEICRGDAPAPTGTVILASSDLSHYLSPRKTDELDRIALEPLLKRDPAGLLTVVEGKNITMCGVRPAVAMLHAANRLGVQQARLLKHCHSGDVAPMRNVVGYASVAFEP